MLNNTRGDLPTNGFSNLARTAEILALQTPYLVCAIEDMVRTSIFFSLAVSSSETYRCVPQAMQREINTTLRLPECEDRPSANAAFLRRFRGGRRR